MKTLFFLLLLTSLFNCSQPERKCKDFKTGTFKFDYSEKGETKTGYITRTENLQIERYDNKIDSSEVRWINDCEVIFKTINPKRMIDKNDIHLKIIATTDSSYTFEYSYIGKNQKQKGVAIRDNINTKPPNFKYQTTLYRIINNPFMDDSDSLTRMKIDNNKIRMYYKDDSIATLYNYNIKSQANTLTNKIDHFLELKNTGDTLKYEILEHSKTILSLKYLPNDKIYKFSTKTN